MEKKRKQTSKWIMNTFTIGVLLFSGGQSIFAVESNTNAEEEQSVSTEEITSATSTSEETMDSSEMTTDGEQVFYKGQWLDLSKQPEDIEKETPLITEENQNILGQGNQSHLLSRSARSTTTFDPADKTKPPVDFIDVASYQGDLSFNDYENMKKYGVRGVVVKLTEGTTYKNPNARIQINNAKAAGLKVSAYHYSWFTSKKQAEEEADFFAQTAKELGLDGNTVMVNDAENGIMNNGYATDNSIYFALRLINQHKFNNVIHYSYANWFNSGVLNKDKLDRQSVWVAQYPNEPSCNTLLHTDTAGWQWTSQVVFPEISGKRFDTNVDYLGYFVTRGFPMTPPKITGITTDTRNTTNGKFRVTIKVQSSDAVKQVRVPIWSTSDQSNIYWYNAEKESSDTWKVDFDVHHHGNIQGEYNVHAYVTTINGYSTAQPLSYKVAVKSSSEDTVPVYRVYNPNSSEHFYTTNTAERNMLIRIGWRDEGLGWYSAKDGSPVYRVYNPNTGDHHYTTSKTEINNLVKNGWRDEGKSWNSAGSVPIYRLYNPNQKNAGAHHFTKDGNEKNALVRAGWNYEGVSWQSK